MKSGSLKASITSISIEIIHINDETHRFKALIDDANANSDQVQVAIEKLWALRTRVHGLEDHIRRLTRTNS